jgi:hypothetical protein
MDLAPAFPPAVLSALGADRSARIAAAVDSLTDLEPSVPDESTWALVRPYAGSPEDISRRRMVVAAEKDSTWHEIRGAVEEGKVVWMATNLISSVSSRDFATRVALFDLHPRMAAWALTARWRAEELTRDTLDGLARWRIVGAAATARALLEGVLAFLGESRAMAAAWADMKAWGPPKLPDALGFRAVLDNPLTQAHHATRAGKSSAREAASTEPDRLARRNVLTLMKHGAKAAGLDYPEIETVYAQLSDAAHPSAGAQESYTIRRQIHPSEAQMYADIGRGADAVPVRSGHDAARPDVAFASAEALCISVEQFVRLWPEFIRVVDDFGLTTQVGFATSLDYWRRHDRPQPNAPCPCGSGRKWKKCTHEWGASSAEPLIDE